MLFVLLEQSDPACRRAAGPGFCIAKTERQKGRGVLEGLPLVSCKVAGVGHDPTTSGL